jgi:hypothetical protein
MWVMTKVEPGGIPNHEIPYGDSRLKVKTAGVNPAASVPKWRCPTKLMRSIIGVSISLGF